MTLVAGAELRGLNHLGGQEGEIETGRVRSEEGDKK